MEVEWVMGQSAEAKVRRDLSLVSKAHTQSQRMGHIVTSFLGRQRQEGPSALLPAILA